MGLQQQKAYQYHISLLPYNRNQRAKRVGRKRPLRGCSRIVRPNRRKKGKRKKKKTKKERRLAAAYIKAVVRDGAQKSAFLSFGCSIPLPHVQLFWRTAVVQANFAQVPRSLFRRGGSSRKLGSECVVSWIDKNGSGFSLR